MEAIDSTKEEGEKREGPYKVAKKINTALRGAPL